MWRTQSLDIQLTLQARTSNSQCTPTAFSLPFYLPENSRVSKFVAREEELTRMQEALKGAAQLRRVVNLHGPGGRGKTQLAIEYAQRHREDYSAIVWLDARDETAINQSFARLANESSTMTNQQITSLCIQSKDQNQIVAAVKRWFDEPANSSWLIIYDNHRNPVPSNVCTKDRIFARSQRKCFPHGFYKPGEKLARPKPFDISKYYQRLTMVPLS